jgi:hypothetical protein
LNACLRPEYKSPKRRKERGLFAGHLLTVRYKDSKRREKRGFFAEHLLTAGYRRILLLENGRISTQIRHSRVGSDGSRSRLLSQGQQLEKY